MRHLTATLYLTLAVLLGSAGMGWGADFQKGLDAVQRGDYTTALREWKPLAKQGVAFAQYNLGVMYANGQGVPQNYKTAVKWFRLAAEQGLALAQINLGLMYREGQGVHQNYKNVMKWFRLAAEQGDAGAMYNIGLMYYYGQGVIQDNVYAHMWINISASNGEEDGVMARDIIEKEMSSADISQAQKLARECVAKNYKGC